MHYGEMTPHCPYCLKLFQLQHPSDCDIRNKKEDEVAQLYKSHAAIIDQRKFMPGDVKNTCMKLISPPTAANQKEQKPKQNQGKIQDETPDENLRRNLQSTFQLH
jgi:hypothetical protein